MFRGRRAYVERTCDRWFVLSAKYGLIEPDRLIQPYDQTLVDASTSERRRWSRGIIRDLTSKLGDLRGVIFECHAGQEYLDYGLVAGLLARDAQIVRPTKGLGLGRQLAFYRGATEATQGRTTWVPPKPDLVQLPAEPPALPPRPPINRTALVAALLKVGASLPADQLIALGPDPDSDELMRKDGFAFLLGVIFDQGIPYERAWRAPFELRQRLGYLEPSRIVADPEAVRRAVSQPPALHRYINNLPTWIVMAAQRVIDEYGSDAERIWNDRPPAHELNRRLIQFQGIGQKKAAMAVEILERQRGVAVTHLQGSDIAFDVHVRRVFLRTGIAERDDQQHMVERARELNPDRPGALDYPAW